jgi:large subunit ribosomal protein L17
MVTSLFEHERITTTVPKAREARRVAERLITVAKRGDLHARRHVAGYVHDDMVVKKLFDTIAPWYENRPGGYTRIFKLGNRLGDGGEIGILELIKTGEQREADTKEREERARRRAERKAERVKARADAVEAARREALGEEAPEEAEEEEEEKEKK